MFEDFGMTWLAAALLGMSVGLDPFISGRKSALVTHTAAAVMTALFVQYNAGLNGASAVPSALLALLSALALACLWADRSKEESTSLVLITIAMVFGVACGTANWSIAAVTWTAMLCLYIRRVSLATEPAVSGRNADLVLSDKGDALEPFAWSSDLRWVREMAKCPRPEPSWLERLGLKPAGGQLKFRLQ